MLMYAYVWYIEVDLDPLNRIQCAAPKWRYVLLDVIQHIRTVYEQNFIGVLDIGPSKKYISLEESPKSQDLQSGSLN